MITITHLEKSLGKTQVLRDINLEIAKGDIISIIGPSGAGKSTLLRCMNLLEQPTGGQILFNGQDIMAKGTDISKLRRKIGMVFQSFHLFEHLSAKENVMFGLVRVLRLPHKEAEQKAQALLAMVGLSALEDSYPEELSGGQKQRVAIARTIALKPDMILFDEPTSALDPTMVREVLSVMRRLAKDGMTMAIVTHEMSFAKEISSRVLYMDEGIIYEQGSPTAIFDNPKQEKTRIFIRQTKLVSAEITCAGFDFWALCSKIDALCNAENIVRKRLLKLTLLLEEVVYKLICIAENPNRLPLRFSLEYSEQKDDIALLFCYPGPAYNPLTDENADAFSVLITQKIATTVAYTYEMQENRLLLHA